MSRARVLAKASSRRLVLALEVVAAVALLILARQKLAGPTFVPVGGVDFVQYWSAARMLMKGENPYDHEAILALEQTLGWTEAEPAVFWNPPPTLAIVLPFALLPFWLATLAWMAALLTIILASGALLWRYFARGDRRFWIGLALAGGAAAGLYALRMGQISPFLLAGVVGFLWAERRRLDLVAGGMLALLMIKPHVAYLFWPAALWWSWRSHRRRVIVGWLGAIAAASVIVFVVSPDVYRNFLNAASAPPFQWFTPTLGAWLRYLAGPTHTWLHFLPAIVAGLALVAYLALRRGPWRWEWVALILLLPSSFTSVYSWSNDHLVLLPIVVAAIAYLRSAPRVRLAVAIGVYAIAQVGVMLVNHWQLGDHYTAWYPLVVAWLLWWGLRWGTGPHSRLAPGATP